VPIRIDLDAQFLSAPIGEIVRTARGRDIGLAGGGLARLWLGQRGHQVIQAERVAEVVGYQPEYPVGGRLELDGWTVELTGRADGVVLAEGDEPVEVEEIKTVHMGRDLFGTVRDDRIEQYRQQLRLYAHLLSGDRPPIRALLTLVDVFDGRSRSEEVDWAPAGVQSWLRRRVAWLVAQQRARAEHRAACAAAGEVLPFPHEAVRPAQEPMMEAVTDALFGERHLLVAAPTGVGKTAAALHPALRHALTSGKRAVFLTAKTLQQEMAVRTARGMQPPAGPWHSIQLRAKSAMCANDEQICHEDVCPFAASYLRRRDSGDVLAQILAAGPHIDPDEVFAVGRDHELCPFELSLDLLADVELVVCDYNYVFDPRIGLDAVVGDGTLEDSILVIDEAHNLVDRAREYYSPSLSLAHVREALDELGARSTTLFMQLQDALQDLQDALQDMVDEAFGGTDRSTVFADIDPDPLGEARRTLDPLMLRYAQFRREQELYGGADAVMGLYFELTHFHRILLLHDDPFVQLAVRDEHGEALKILCLDASKFLADVFEGSAGVVAMSATLEPFGFYQDLLGFDPDGTDTLSLPPPFPPENCLVLVDDRVDTTWQGRQRHWDDVARTVQQAALPGRNALALFPSYAFLSEIARRVHAPDHRVEVQRVGDRQQHLEVLELLRGGEPVLLLGVLGGVFAEGVDYPGEMLSCVIVVSPGLPQVEPERELLKGWYQRAYGDGFGYAFLVPGMRRVIQAAGRLIRSDTDRGAILLIGRRFLQPRYAALLPQYWTDGHPESLRSRNPVAEIQAFLRSDP